MVINILAIDLGASSGRGIVYTFDNNNISFKEVHRFSNSALEENGNLYWNIDSIFEEVCIALKNADKEFSKINSIGIDTWGVDFGIIGKDGKLIEKPRHYRNKVNAETRESLKNKAYSFFEIAGISDNDFNTLYQLIALKREGFDFSKVDSILFMPQLIGYMLTGKKATEPTIASTSGFFKKDKGFDTDFLEEYGIPYHIFPEVKQTGQILGFLKEDVKKSTGIGYDVPVILTAGHDTACAVATLDTADTTTLYLSSGTWSLFGTFTNAPIISREVFNNGYTNELSADGRVCFLKNIIGMWIIQECRRQWAQEGKDYSYPDIVEIAKNAKDKGVYIDVNDAIFMQPGNMADKVKNYVAKNYSLMLCSDGEIALCVYKSMAKAYKKALDGLASITCLNYKSICIIGGGVNNKFLNKLIGEELHIPVLIGDSEASALGNAMVQYKALKQNTTRRNLYDYNVSSLNNH